MISRRGFAKAAVAATAGAAAGTKIIKGTLKGVDASPVIPPKEWGGSERVGIRPNGTYWGGHGESIDVLAGNLNYSMPLAIAGGRGVNIKVTCSYNSQI